VKVIIREAAFADLENIYNWIAKDSPANARAVAMRVLDAVENKIAHFPFMGAYGKNGEYARMGHTQPALHHRLPDR
jgi:plasmid stabilization system protein ParE